MPWDGSTSWGVGVPDDPISWAEALARVDEALAEVSALRHHVKELQERQRQIMQSQQFPGLDRDGAPKRHVTDAPTPDEP